MNIDLDIWFTWEIPDKSGTYLIEAELVYDHDKNPDNNFYKGTVQVYEKDSSSDDGFFGISALGIGAAGTGAVALLILLWTVVLVLKKGNKET